jgi:hypothetical protein
MRKTTILAAAVAAALAAYTARADVQDYSAASGTPGVGVDHPGFGFFQLDAGAWDSGLDAAGTHPPAGEFEFAGSDGAFHMEAHCVLNQGFTGRTGDHAALFIMDYDPMPPTTSFGSFWFGGVGNDIGPLPSTNYSNVLAYVDVIAPAGKPIEFRTESDYGPSGNGFKFYGTGAGTWQTVGGALSTAVTFGTFNPNDPQLASLVAFGHDGHEIDLVDNGSDPNNHPTLIVDNLTLTIALATWNASGGGSWGTNTNWSPIAPNGGNATAVFGSSITAPSTVTVEGTKFIGTLRFDNANSYTIGGTGTLTIRAIGAGTHGAIDVVSGSHAITAATEIWSDTTVTVTPAASTLDTSGTSLTVFPNVTLTKEGAGNWRARGIQAGALAINAGTVTIAPNGSNAGTSRVGTLAIAGGATPTATLDLNDNDLIVTSGSVSAVAAQIRNARNGGAWNQSGITSSAARTQTNHATTIGVESGADYKSANGPSATFDGFPVADSDVLAKYTWYGDTDFNGKVNFDDYVRTDNGFNNHLTGWINGDFDLNGSVNFDDYVLIDLAFNTQSGTLGRALSFVDGSDRSSNGMNDPALQRVVRDFGQFGSDYANHLLAAVPEPTCLGLFTLASLATLRRVRRRA